MTGYKDAVLTTGDCSEGPANNTASGCNDHIVAWKLLSFCDCAHGPRRHHTRLVAVGRLTVHMRKGACIPGIWNIACVVPQDGIHHGRHQAPCHQTQVFTLVYKGLNQLQSDLQFAHSHGQQLLFTVQVFPASLKSSHLSTKVSISFKVTCNLHTAMGSSSFFPFNLLFTVKLTSLCVAAR